MPEVNLLSMQPRIIFDALRAITLATGQCDACPPTIPSTFTIQDMLPNVCYTFDPLVALNKLNHIYDLICTEQSSGPFLLNHSAMVLANHFTFPRPLDNIPPSWRLAWGDAATRSTLEKMVALGLLVPAGYAVSSPKEIVRTLTSWLHLTHRCNLRCDYCYLPRRGEDMSIEIGYAAIDATFRSAMAHGYRQVKLKYAGGEPLLCFPLVAELHQYAQKLADQRGLALDGVVLSNGTLLTKLLISKLQSMNLRLTISLDGLGEIHDRQRPYANGRGSAVNVIDSVELALDHGLVPGISITISGRTIEGLPDLIDWVLKRDLPFSLNFYRENDFSAPHTGLQLEESRIISGMRAAFKLIEVNLPRHSLLAALVDRANLATPHVRTCGVGRSYLVFDSFGNIAKCQMQIDKVVTTVQANDPLAFVQADQDGIQNISVEEKGDCRSCRWRYWCTGGCSLATYRARGHYDVKSPYCGIYQALLPEALRLEGMRLLKYADEAGIGQ